MQSLYYDLCTASRAFFCNVDHPYLIYDQGRNSLKILVYEITLVLGCGSVTHGYEMREENKGFEIV